MGRYIVLSLLGVGGMGVVVAAYDSEIDRKVALKLVRVDARRDEDPDASRARVLREARAMAKISHANVAQVFDVGAHKNRVFLAMELVAGGTLSGWLAKETRSWQEVLRIFAEAGRGLAAAHQAGVVHRDFKPSNVLVGADGKVKVADFGLAHARANDEGPAGVKRPLVGTPAYMDPSRNGASRSTRAPISTATASPSTRRSTASGRPPKARAPGRSRRG